MTQSPGLRARALAILGRREHSRAELERKLAPHAESIEEIGELLDDFERRGFLREGRALDEIVHARRGKFGAARIRQELERKGIGQELIASAMPRLKDGDLDAGRAVWTKKFGAAPRNAQERARQIRFLQGRGFALETALAIVKGGDDE